ARGSTPELPPSGTHTLLLEEPVRLSAAMLPAPELASVHGGATVTGSHALDMRDARGGNRWTFAVLGIAALLGIAAALAIQLAPSPDLEQPTTAPEPAPAIAAAEQTEPPPVATPPAPAPVPTVTTEAIATP